MGNNLDCSNKSQVKVYTLEPALGNSPPLLLLLPWKADPNKFIRFHIDAFFSLPIHALKDLKPLCKFTFAPLSQDFAKCMVYRSSQLIQHKNKLHWSYLNCASAILCLKLFSSFGENIWIVGIGWESWGEWMSSGSVDQLIVVKD